MTGGLGMPEKTYSKLIKFETFLERYRYLKLGGVIGNETFGFDRYVNQKFYSSKEWKSIRNAIIVRDFGCDLGVQGYEICGHIFIHHMNPISVSDIDNYSKILFDSEYLVCVSRDTHNAIHYGDENLLIKDPVIRFPNDTVPWKKS